MRSFGECPNVENVLRLSQILTDRPHPKYFLSARACAWILRRAEKRGKELPPMLKEALMKQSASLNVPDVKGGKAYSYSEKEQDHYQHSTINQCYNISGDDIAGTLDASYYRGVGARSGKEREVVAQPIYPQIARTLSARDSSPCIDRGQNIVCFGISAYDSNAMKSNNPHSGIYEADTARTLDNNGGSPACNQGGIAVCDARGNGDGEIVPTITGDHNGHLSDYTAICYGLDRSAYNQGANAQYDFSVEEDKIATCVAKGPGAVCSVDCRNGSENEACNGTLQAKNGGISYNLNNVCRVNATVRRLTPLECERLQGYPDNWTDIGDWTDSKGKLHRSEQNDSARYKALGNSIALPFWQWLAERICKQYEQQPTMASLFDGIGGFPLVFSRAGAKPEWSSEIEEFPIAVTRVRFTEG